MSLPQKIDYLGLSGVVPRNERQPLGEVQIEMVNERTGTASVEIPMRVRDSVWLLDNTDVMLALVWNWNAPKTKLKKLCLKLKKRAYPEIGAGILSRVLNASDPGREIRKASQEVDEFSDHLKVLGDEGYYGMAIYDKRVYPVELVFEEDDDYKWAIENENLMRVKCAHALMNLLNLPFIACQVLLFGTKGFSADYTHVEVARSGSGRKGVTLTADGDIIK